MNKEKWISVGVILAAVIILTSGATSCSLKHENTEKNKEVEVSKPEQDDKIDAWGEVKYDKVYDVNIDFPSTVTDIKAKEGDHVSLGDELMTLDIEEYQGDIYKLKQQLSQVDAEIAQTQKDISTKTRELKGGSSSELKLLQSSLTRAKKETQDAKKDVQDNQSLYTAGTISKDTLDQYIDILNQKEKVQSDTEENIEKTKKSMQDGLDQLNLSLKAKQAQSEQIKTDLTITENKGKKAFLNGDKIISCVKNGIVQNISVNNASRLGAQNAPVRILQLIDEDSMIVSAEVQEEFIKNISLGQNVSISPASDSSLSIPGTVIRIPNVAVEKDGKRIVKVEVKPRSKNELLKPGYSVDVFFPIKK